MDDPRQVEDVRNRIIQLAREIEEFSQTNVSRETFFREFLKRLVAALGARAGAVWMMNGNQRLDLLTDVRFAETGLADNGQVNPQNHRLLAEVIQNGQAYTFSPDERTDIQLPTPHLVILAALQQDKQCVGAVEIFQRPDTPREARPGYLQFVEQMCGFASRYLDSKQQPSTTLGTSKFWQDFEQFVLQLQRSLAIAEVAGTTANDGRRLIECDRLSVALQHGRKTIVKSISGQDSVNQRANLVRTMTDMASKVIAMREPFTYSGRVDDLPPQIEKPLADYIQESGSRMVMVIPLLESTPLIGRDDKEDPAAKRKKKPPRAIGGLIIEQVTESRPKSGLQERAELVAEHAAAALHNAQTHEHLFLLPLWRFLGRIFGWFRGRNLLKAAAALAVVAAIGVAMALVPYEYRVEADGRLMPVVQSDLFAPWEGEVAEIFINSREEVKKGQKLLRLENKELRAELLARTNEFQNKQRALITYQTELRRAETKQDEIRLQGRIAETKVEIAGLEQQVAILQERLETLTIRSPIDGVVATFNLQQKLKDRPVQRGELLLEVMDKTQNWQLELDVGEHRMGHILRGQENLNTEQLTLEFILATAPERTFYGRLIEIGSRSNAKQEKGSIVQVHASIDESKAKLPDRRIGAEVTAKINCGKRALGYCLFGDVIETARKFFWL